MSVSLIAATLNEIEAVKVVLPNISKDWVDEIVITDGGSTDATLEYCRDQGYTIVEQQGKGYGDAIREAVAVAKGDVIIEFPPDGNSLPEKIPDVVEEINEGYDFVIVSRYKDGARSYDDDFMTAIGNRMFTFITNVFFGTSYTDVLVGYRAYRKAAYSTLGLDASGLSWPAQEAIRFAVKGFKVAEIGGDEPKRIGGRRKMKVIRTGLEISALILKEFWIAKMRKE